MPTMQQRCEVDVIFIKWRIGVTSKCDAGFLFDNSNSNINMPNLDRAIALEYLARQPVFMYSHFVRFSQLARIPANRLLQSICNTNV